MGAINFASAKPLGFGLNFARGVNITLEESYLVDFGRKTLEGYGGWHPVDGVTAATITADDATNTGHWEVIDSYKIAPTAAGEGSLVASYSLEVTYYVGAAIVGVVTVDITTLANGYSVANDTELTTIFNAAATAYGDTIYLRGGNYNEALSFSVRFRRQSGAFSGTFVAPSLFDASHPELGVDPTTGTKVTVTAHAGETPVVHQAYLDMQDDDGAGNPYAQGVRFTGLTFYYPLGTANTFCFRMANTQETDQCYVYIDNNTFYCASSVAEIDTSSAAIAGGLKLDGGAHVYVMDNYIRGIRTGINTGCSNHDIMRNRLQECWEDGVAFQSRSNLRICSNDVFDKLDLDESTGVHGDMFQGTDGGATAENILIYNNFGWRGQGEEGRLDGQFIFIYNISTVISNLVIIFNFGQCSFGNGIAVQAANAPFIAWNSCISDPEQNVPGSDPPRFVFRSCTDAEIENNIYQQLVEITPVGSTVTSNNIEVDVDATTGDEAFANVFVDPVDSDQMLTRADVIAAYALKTGGPADAATPIGAIGTGFTTNAYDATYTLPA